MQITGISAVLLNAQPLNPVILVKPVKTEEQAAQATTILMASSTDSSQSQKSTSSFMYMASSSGGITMIEEMSFTSSFSVTAGGVQSSSGVFEASSVSASDGVEFSYASANTSSLTASERGIHLRFDATA